MNLEVKDSSGHPSAQRFIRNHLCICGRLGEYLFGIEGRMADHRPGICFARALLGQELSSLMSGR